MVTLINLRGGRGGLGDCVLYPFVACPCVLGKGGMLDHYVSPHDFPVSCSVLEKELFALLDGTGRVQDNLKCAPQSQ